MNRCIKIIAAMFVIIFFVGIVNAKETPKVTPTPTPIPKHCTNGHGQDDEHGNCVVPTPTPSPTPHPIHTPTLIVENSSKNIFIGGKTNFSVVLTSPDDEKGVLSWTTDSGIKANINGLTSGHITTNSRKNIPNYYTLNVEADNGVVIGHEYNIYLQYNKSGEKKCYNYTMKVKTTATVIPTPELSTFVFSAIGLIGILGYIKFGKKN